MMWSISAKVPLPLANALLEALEPFTESVSISEDKKDSRLWHVHALTSVKPSPDELQNVIQTLCPPHSISEPIMLIEEIPDKNWVLENDQSFPPLTIGVFYVYGVHHDTVNLPPEKVCLHIEASTAFGTGRHGTTQGCLEALESLYKEGLKFQKIIDIGTGTGILAIASAKLFKAPVIATDIDPEAIHKAQENIHLNGCSPLVSLIKADSSTPPTYPPFDLVIANILANTLIELSPFIIQSTHLGSILILSGILQDQASRVEEAFQLHHFEVKKRIIHQEWITLVLAYHHN